MQKKKKKHLTALPLFHIISLSKLGLEKKFNSVKDTSKKTTNNVVLIAEDQILYP